MTHRILVVDDEPTVRRALVRLFRRMEVSVAEAGNGRIALEQLGKTPFDLVICDLRMPVLDGKEMLRQLELRYDSPPSFILLTGYSPEDASWLEGKPHVKLLTKPVIPARLRDTVRSMLAG